MVHARHSSAQSSEPVGAELTVSASVRVAGKQSESDLPTPWTSDRGGREQRPPSPEEYRSEAHDFGQPEEGQHRVPSPERARHDRARLRRAGRRSRQSPRRDAEERSSPATVLATRARIMRCVHMYCASSRRAADTVSVCSSTERNSPSPRRRGGVELNVSGRLSPGRSAARAKEMRARQASPKPWHRESTIASDGSLRTGRRGASPVRPRPPTVALHPLSLR